jgi:hypothetical protein
MKGNKPNCGGYRIQENKWGKSDNIRCEGSRHFRNKKQGLS